jgi:hypothetical protein
MRAHAPSPMLRPGPPLPHPPRGDPAPRLNPPKQFSGAEAPPTKGTLQRGGPDIMPGPLHRFSAQSSRTVPTSQGACGAQQARAPSHAVPGVAAPHAADLDSRSHAASTFAFDAGRVHHSRPSNVVGQRSATVASIASRLAAISRFTWSASSEVMAVGS